MHFVARLPVVTAIGLFNKHVFGYLLNELCVPAEHRLVSTAAETHVRLPVFANCVFVEPNFRVHHFEYSVCITRKDRSYIVSSVRASWQLTVEVCVPNALPARRPVHPTQVAPVRPATPEGERG